MTMSLFDFVRRTAAAAAAIAVLTGGTAAAQSPARDPDLATLARKLRAGDRVAVTRPSGERVRGVFAGLSPDRLLVDTDAGRRAIPAGDVDRITRTRFGVVLGTLIGLGTGVALAIPLNMLIANEGGDALGDTAKLLALTTGIGFGVDAAVNLPRTVYRRGERPHVRVAPAVTPRGAGVAMQIGF
jgi:hypothetical protein